MALDVVTGLLNSFVEITKGFLGTVKQALFGVFPGFGDLAVLLIAVGLAFLLLDFVLGNKQDK